MCISNTCVSEAQSCTQSTIACLTPTPVATTVDKTKCQPAAGGYYAKWCSPSCGTPSVAYVCTQSSSPADGCTRLDAGGGETYGIFCCAQ